MANWLLFEKVKEWDAAVLPFFQYDVIEDKAIAKALANAEVLRNVDASLDWESDRWLYNCKTVPDAEKHAYRVAALVEQFRTGEPMREAISLDTFNLRQCGCGVGNGHHRVRALQYMGIPYGPFSLGGYVDPLEDLVRLAGTDVLPEHGQYFSAELLEPEAGDILRIG